MVVLSSKQMDDEVNKVKQAQQRCKLRTLNSLERLYLLMDEPEQTNSEEETAVQEKTAQA